MARCVVYEKEDLSSMHFHIETAEPVGKRSSILPCRTIVVVKEVHLLDVDIAEGTWLLELADDHNVRLLCADKITAERDSQTLLLVLCAIAFDS